jgi:hypothetical protein
MLHFEPFAGAVEDWDAVLDTYPDREVFQTSAWLRFIAESQNGTIVLATLKDDNETVGHFAGLIVKKFGLRILGSPFIGWTTERMGIRLRPDVPRHAAVEALMRYTFRDLKCIHLELADANITPDVVSGLGFESRITQTHIVDLSPDEDTVFQNMAAKSARYSIRKAAKLGVVIEEAQDEQFAADYVAQMQEVFVNQGLVPSYGKDRILLLMRHLLPTGHLLLLRARAPDDGRCIATGIFLGMCHSSYFWGNASWSKDRHFCPNEPLHWHAMRYWKQRGVDCYDMCGAGDYKRKYGSKPVERYYLSRSNRPWIALARKIAFMGFRAKQRIMGFWQDKRRGGNEGGQSTDEGSNNG